MSTLSDMKKIREAVRDLDAITPGDEEANHGTADAILLRFVPTEVREAWERAEERDGGWWYA